VLFGFLAVASFIAAALKFFPVQTWIVHIVNIRRQRNELRDYIPHMTAQERAIIACLLDRNQKMFTAGDHGSRKGLTATDNKPRIDLQRLPRSSRPPAT